MRRSPGFDQARPLQCAHSSSPRRSKRGTPVLDFDRNTDSLRVRKPEGVMRKLSPPAAPALVNAGYLGPPKSFNIGLTRSPGNGDWKDVAVLRSIVALFHRGGPVRRSYPGLQVTVTVEPIRRAGRRSKIGARANTTSVPAFQPAISDAMPDEKVAAAASSPQITHRPGRSRRPIREHRVEVARDGADFGNSFGPFLRWSGRCAARDFLLDPDFREIARLRRLRNGRIFQPFPTTWEDRYPEVFEAIAERLADHDRPRIFSFGCATGEEVRALRKRMPRADILGIDANARAIAKAIQADPTHSAQYRLSDRPEPGQLFDAILAMAVFRHGELEATRPESCADILPFRQFKTESGDSTRRSSPGSVGVTQRTLPARGYGTRRRIRSRTATKASIRTRKVCSMAPTTG